MRQANYSYEIVFVDDDSGDGIEERVRQSNHQSNIVLKIRKDERGLSSAVIAGFGLAKGDIIVVMDADLSHPPEKIPELVHNIISRNSEFVIGSRFVEGGAAPHFNAYRKLNAYVSKLLVRPLTKVKDPLAGFFAFPRRILENNSVLNPLGFKIGLEVMVKCAPRIITEIPIRFQERLYGESKLSLKEQLLYLLHIKRLYEYRFQGLYEFMVFSLIGCTGMVIDLGCTYLGKEMLNLSFPVARAIGFVLALTNNFILNKRFNFKLAQKRDPAKQYLSFFIISLVAFAVNWGLSVYLYEKVEFFESHYLISAFLGIMAGLSVNFAGNKTITFR